MKFRDTLASLNWYHCIFFFLHWTFTLYGVITTEFQAKTVIFTFIFGFFSALGITCGYHRLYAHKSYEAGNLYRLFIMLCASASVEGSCKWWSINHRLHHRYTDTKFDPYSAQKGFFWCHLGWMLFKPDPKLKKTVPVEDLRKDKLVQFQHKYFPLVAFPMAFLFPTLVCGLGWGDYRGGYFIGGLLRLFFVHHMTFSVNSVAHYLGDQPFDDRLTPRDNVLTALITLGEGYHNFHHEFPGDYRNGIYWKDYDPSKWFIKTCSLLGLTYNLKTFDNNEIKKGRFQMKVKKLTEEKKQISWPKKADELPIMTKKEFIETGKAKGLIVFEGLVYNVQKFVPDHPGGENLLRSFLGRDITKQFRGEVYEHSNGAENLLSMMRIARLEKSE